MKNKKRLLIIEWLMLGAIVFSGITTVSVLYATGKLVTQKERQQQTQPSTGNEGSNSGSSTPSQDVTNKQ